LSAAIRGWVFTSVLIAFGLLGCAPTESGGGTGGTGATGGTGGSGPTGPLVVTADWLNQSLTLFDYDKLIDGESDATASIIGTIDLSAWEPGPIEVELTPDGKTAVVSVGPGFFDGTGLTNMIIGSPTVPPGGTLLVVDLESGEAVSIQTEDVPLGIAINPEGTIAYTANYGTTDARGDSLSIIDIEALEVIEEIMVGSGPEQVVLSADGALGAVNIAGEDGIRVFQTSDVTGTMSEVLATGNDPSDLTFLDGNTELVVANRQSSNVTLVDTSNPSMPTVVQNFMVSGGVGVPYGLTFVPSRSSILAPISPLSPTSPANLVTIEVDGRILQASFPEELPGGSFPLTAAVDSTGNFAFVAHVSDNQLSIIDLETGATRAISWLAEPGPTYVAVQR
jgi:YVTN family beta-propeller protein